jgi:hypothetical protein
MYVYRIYFLLLFALAAACAESADPATSTTQVDGASLDASDTSGDANLDVTVESEVVNASCESAEKPFMCPCDYNVDCLSGFCIAVEDEVHAQVCTKNCGEEECPVDWRCETVEGAGDPTYICVPVIDFNCDPCTSNLDCGGPGDQCTDLDDGSFCTMDCSDPDTDCHEGFSCQGTLDAEGQPAALQCMPDNGSCSCLPSVDLSSDKENCGVCGNACAFNNALSTCVGAVCQLKDCEPGWTDLDNSVDTGCEYECGKTSENDEPDPSGLDANCDGIDGDEDRAVFVAPWGAQGGPGTKINPVPDVASGIAKAKALGRDHVYIAAGTYEERVIVSAGVSLFGGYSEDGSWTRNLSTNLTIIQSDEVDEDGVIRAMIIEGVQTPTTIGGLQIQSGNNPETGGSSYGVWMSQVNSAVTLRTSRVVSGSGGPGGHGTNGLPGASGVPGGQGTSTSDTDYNCNEFETYGGVGGQGGNNTCAVALSSGGDGADGSCGDDAANAGAASVAGALGGSGEEAGVPGLPGGSGEHGVGGPEGGSISELSFWFGGAGVTGAAGLDGQGGGGGGSGAGHDGGLFGFAMWGGGGGGGGSGGCGGTAGQPGLAGGGSFAVFLVDASPKLFGNTFSHNSGGHGGNGGVGGPGGPGKPGGPGGTGHDKATDGGPGGDGGVGGFGGNGGGGSGGDAYGLYMVGSSNPNCDGNAAQPLGWGGSGGVGGGLEGNFGAPGLSGDVNLEGMDCP